MLPTEAFADAIAFLRLFDLSALAVTNALCSTLAVKASTKVRWEEFPAFRFYISHLRIEIIRLPELKDGTAVAILTFTTESDMIEFVAAAFPNCFFEDVVLSASFTNNRHLWDTMGEVAGSVIVNGALRLPGRMNTRDSLGLVRKFWKVKAFLPLRELSDVEADQVADFYCGSGAQELQYYRSFADFFAKPQKIAFF